MEEWREVVGCPAYKVSSRGRVTTICGRVRAPKPGPKGYVTVGITNDGQTTLRLVHRLVAEAFLPNLEGKPMVNHINGLRADNRATNLEWATAQENAACTINPSGTKGRKRRVIQLSRAEAPIMVHDTLAEAAKACGLRNPAGISRACRTGGTAAGFRWQYADEAPLPTEEWREATVGGRRFTVSSCGRVRGATGKISRGFLSGGYLAVGHVYVHRLVAAAFLPAPGDGKRLVNHLDGDKTNNTAGNLEWSTARENAIHARRLGLRPPGNAGLRRRVRYTSAAGVATEYNSVGEAARATRSAQSKITLVCQGRQPPSAGSKWEYVETPPAQIPEAMPLQLIADDDPLWVELGL